LTRSGIAVVAVAFAGLLAPVSDATRADIVARASKSVVVVETALGSGSAFAFGDRGEYLTNAHVVEGTDVVRIVANDGSSADADVVARDTARDVALLRSKLVEPPLRASKEQPRAGDEVLAIGAPHGLQGTVTDGIVSAVDRPVGGVPMLQTDVAVNPGNSGGPLLDAHGAVVGVTTSKATLADGIAFAIPIDAAARAVGTSAARSEGGSTARGPAISAHGGRSAFGAGWLLGLAGFGLATIVLAAAFIGRLRSGSAGAATAAVPLHPWPAVDPVIVVRRHRREPPEQPSNPDPETSARSEEQWT
jgi:S1-C subfamily serine protease